MAALGVILTTSGEIRNAKVSFTNPSVGCQLADIHKYMKRKQESELLGTYPWKENTLYLFGYKTGKQEAANKHALPPPLEGQTFYGDILVLAASDKNDYSQPKRFKPDEYEAFYNRAISGDDEEGDDENEENDTHESEEEEDGNETDTESESESDVGEIEEEEEEEEDAEEEIPEEEDECPAVVRVPTAKPKSRTKRKEATPMVVVPVTLVETELEAEREPSSSGLNSHRSRVLTSLQSLSNEILTPAQQVELEHYIFNVSLKIAEKRHVIKHWSQSLFVNIYTMHARSIIGNLIPSSYIQNPYLYNRLKSGDLTLKEIASFGFSDLYPDIWKDLSIKQFEREKRQLEGNKSMATDQFQCKRCGKRECIYYELQTRSADEPMTIFIQCVNCGKHWRQ